MKSWFRNQFRRRVRVYIFPTKMGGYLNGLIFLMFLLAVGYANNLLLIFTLFLLSFNMVWLVQTHFHLAALKLEEVTVSNGHALDSIGVQVRWKRSPQMPFKWDLRIEGHDLEVPLSTLEETSSLTSAEIRLPKRGHFFWSHLCVATDLPFGLYRSWIYFPLNVSSYSYPELLKNISLPDMGHTHLEGQIPRERKGTEDIRDLSPYRGEESRKISWKHYARSGDLYVKEGTEWNDHHLHLKLKLPEAPEAKETYLKKISSQLVSAYREQIPFTFEIEGVIKRGPSVQEKHLHDCLKDLSVC